MNSDHDYSCGGLEHVSRRNFMKLAGLSGLSWLTPLATSLARAAEKKPHEKAKSLIVIWLEGAPSQLETFDPHPGREIAAGSRARKTKVDGILLGDGFEQIADLMDSISLVRALTSKEGDHTRAIYNVKTGFRPDPTIVHPAIGSVICHQTLSRDSQVVDIPRHVSIMPLTAPGRGGYLGDQFDAFQVDDPRLPVPDVKSHVDRQRFLRRIGDLNVVDQRFGDGRSSNNASLRASLENHNLELALRMMSSEQLAAFDVSDAPIALHREYGNTPFGRGCMAAVRLVSNGVRCVEVTLGGWDTHVNNHELQAGRLKILDPALASMIRDLRNRDLLDSTIVLCGGEFGRTPFMNALGGRDHWPHGFAIAVAGGGIQGARVIGETSPNPKPESKDRAAELKNSHPIEDIHATVFHALNIDFEQELATNVGRPMKICQGKPILELF
jgi:hypothetical protein